MYWFYNSGELQYQYIVVDIYSEYSNIFGWMEYSQNHIGESTRSNGAQYDLISWTYLLSHQELWLTPHLCVCPDIRGAAGERFLISSEKV